MIHGHTGELLTKQWAINYLAILDGLSHVHYI